MKIISFLLTHLPESYDYRVVFMHRDLGEVLASQNKMLVQRGESGGDTSDERMIKLYETHLWKINRYLKNHSAFEVLELDYKAVMDEALEQARRVNEFVGGHLDTSKMAGIVDKELYRNRR